MKILDAVPKHMATQATVGVAGTLSLKVWCLEYIFYGECAIRAEEDRVTVKT